MSIGSLGIIGSVAATPLAQKGTETERAQATSAAAQRQSQSVEQAENAAGIAETDGQEHSTNERDADGRRQWEIAPPSAAGEESSESGEPIRPVKDPTGESGNQLDLTG